MAPIVAKQIFRGLLARRLRHLAPKLDVARHPEAQHMLIANPKLFAGHLGIVFRNYDSLDAIRRSPITLDIVVAIPRRRSPARPPFLDVA